jgi:glycosyltransferase involved in cell wall biosynthesis
MKILMTSETFLPLMGGAEMHVWYLGEKLTRMGHQVTLLTNEPRAGEPTPTHPVTFKVFSILWQRSAVWSIFRKLWSLAGEAEVIHCHYSYRLAMLAGIVGRLRGKPVIVTLHGLGTLDEPGSTFPYKQAHAVYRFLSLNLATKIISTSEDLAIVARQHMINKKKMVIIFNGVDTGIFNPEVLASESLRNKYQNQKIVLTVRRLVPKNGIHFLVESLPLLIQKVPRVKCLMIGGGRMTGYIKERIADLGVGQHVELLGEQDNKIVPQFLQLANVVVFPSTAESSSIACAEAMAMGKSVVSSRVGGLVELIGANNERGELVKLVDWEGSNYDAPIQLPPDRYQALAQAIAGALTNDQSAKTKAAIRFAREELDWGVVATKTLGVYQSLTHAER